MATGYHQFEHQNTILGYSRAGIGPEPLLIFHGFGQDHAVFNSLVDELGERFTLFSFDLFFHGKSKWLLDDTPLTKEYWAEVITHFLDENKIEKFSLIGFSLGGKFVLASLEAFPARVKSIYLLAPDGIKTNLWYRLATHPIVLRPLFKSMILKPGRFLTIVKIAKVLRMVDKGVLRFAQSQMDTEEKRRKVFYSWIVFRLLKFDTNLIAAIINSNQIKLWIILGKFDKIITVKNMNPLLSKLNEYELQIVDAGHNDLIKQSVKVLRNELNHQQQREL